MFELLKSFYQRNNEEAFARWNDEAIEKSVDKGWITKNQAALIINSKEVTTDKG